MARLRSLLYAIFLIVTVIPYAFACVLWAPLPLHLRYKLTVGWPRLAIWGARVICGIRWQVKGWENLPDGPAVILSSTSPRGNAVLSRLHAARSLLRLQEGTAHGAVLRLGLALLRMIAIDRSKGRDAFEQVVAQGRKRMDEGRWPCSFRKARACPGPGRPVQDGRRAAGLAHRRQGHPGGAQRRRMLATQRLREAPGLVTLSIGPAIESQGLPEELNQKVQDWIEGEMRRLNPERYV